MVSVERNTRALTSVYAASIPPLSMVVLILTFFFLTGYLRQDRVEQRRRDKEAAKEKAKLDKYMQTVFGNATTDPWAAEREEREAKAKLIGRRRKSDNYD